MSDQATLLLLKDRLDRVRKARRNSTIAIWIIIIVSVFLGDWYYKIDIIPGLLVAVGLATLVAFITNWYYGLQEVAVLRKIQNIER